MVGAMKRIWFAVVALSAVLLFGGNQTSHAEQSTIDLYFRAGLIKQKLNASDIVDRSFADAIAKAGL